MKNNRVFYVLKKLLKSDTNSDNQYTGSNISGDSAQKPKNNVEENIDYNVKVQITEAQKTRRQKWIEELQGSPQVSSTQWTGNTQNNYAKQLFSELDKVSEGIDKGRGFVLSPLKIEDGQVLDSIINMLIDKFLNQKFLPMDTDLNTKRNSFDPDYGDLKWNITDLVRHKVTKDLNKMLYDKYGFNNKDGKRRRCTIINLLGSI